MRGELVTPAHNALLHAVRHGSSKTAAIGGTLEHLRREHNSDWLRAQVERVWGQLVAQRRIVRRGNRWVVR